MSTNPTPTITDADRACLRAIFQAPADCPDVTKHALSVIAEHRLNSLRPFRNDLLYFIDRVSEGAIRSVETVERFKNTIRENPLL